MMIQESKVVDYRQLYTEIEKKNKEEKNKQNKKKKLKKRR